MWSCLPVSGTPEGIRTSDLPLRRRSLYPAELQARMKLGSGRLLRRESGAPSVLRSKTSMPGEFISPEQIKSTGTQTGLPVWAAAALSC